MRTVKIGGVPEHFNLAWYLTLKEGAYKKEGINLRWYDYYGGSGAMCHALESGEIDIAVILTEGIIKGIIDGNPSKIVQTFVQSPLIWGIHVSSSSQFQSVDQLKGKRAAISRYGSGSHLMAYINAKNNNWNVEKDLKFEVIDNLEGAISGLTDDEADYFLWEKFTTKPIVDNGIFNRIGTCPTPWPCFVIAVSDNFLNDSKNELKTILRIINKATGGFKDLLNIDKIIAERYDQKLEDVQEWLSLTEWSQSVINSSDIYQIQKQLFDLSIIPKIVDYDKLVTRV